MRIFLFSAITIGSLCLGNPVSLAKEVSFNYDIRPILSDACFLCHGLDADAREADLRLDIQEYAFADREDTSPAIVPGDPDESLLIWMINQEDEDERMPPQKHPRSLSEEEKNLLRKWIEEGAEYQQHWSFIPPAAVDLPEVSEKTWPNNGIDHFVLSRLDVEGLQPSEEAKKETLLRRVSLDLTGLPPTIEELDAYLSDVSSEAYERVVDRLLASPHYGERMALVWLDAARYADSGGYQNDMRRSQWPWRDWVIESYNQNMPFDQFTIEQLAGDLLPNATDEQRLATAFNRNHRINNEGGIVPAEYLVEYAADRVETTSTVWMGLTMTCARCHDHKYDPISQKDYYEMFAFFNNIAEHGQDGSIAPVPNMVVYTEGTEEEHLHLKDKIAQVKKTILELPGKRPGRFEAWLGQRQKERDSILSILRTMPVPSLHLPLDSETDRKTGNVRDASRYGVLIGRTASEARLVEDTSYGAGFRLGRTGYIKVSNPYGDGFNSDDPRSWLVQFKAPKVFAGSEGPILVSAEVGTLRGYRLMIEDTGPMENFRISFQLMENADEKIGIEVVSGPIIVPDSPVRIGVTWDGKNKGSGVRLYADGLPVVTSIVIDTLTGSIKTEEPLLVGARAEQDAEEFLRDATLNAGILDDVQIYDEILTADEMAYLSQADPENLMLAHLSEDARVALQTAWIKNDEEGQSLIAQLKDHVASLAQFEKRGLAEVSIMEEMDTHPDTYILQRGAYDKPDKSRKLQPTTPDVLPPMSDSFPRNRLGLAKWLVDPKNPLTARVAVNRYWQMYFGIGLVKTPEDFGSQGESPSHPQLLDWLASTFIKSGWNIKAMQKRIVMSSTYRQSSHVTPGLIEKDPENRLLARGPRFRLDGQSLRDQALAVSGLLAKPIGGPPVMPYQPDGLWDEVSAKGYKYVVGENDELYRRSLYTFWRRTVPPPSMMNFDSASREACSVRLSRTNTPLQALNLMNDPQFVEAARVLAERMIMQGGESPSEQIAYGHRLVLARNPEPEIIRILENGYEYYFDTYQSSPDQADLLINIGATEPRTTLDPIELAAMTTVSNLLLNLDEAVTKE